MFTTWKQSWIILTSYWPENVITIIAEDLAPNKLQVIRYINFGITLNDALIHHTYPVFIITSTNWNIFRVTGPLWGEPPVTGGFPSKRPVTRIFDVFFDLRLNKRSSKQPRRRWFETPLRLLWRRCNVHCATVLTNFPPNAEYMRHWNWIIAMV